MPQTDNTESAEKVAAYVLRQSRRYQRCHIPPPDPPTSTKLFEDFNYLVYWNEWKVLFGGGIRSFCGWFWDYMIHGKRIGIEEYNILQHIQHDSANVCHWHDGLAYHYCDDVGFRVAVHPLQTVKHKGIKLLAIRCHTCNRELQRTQSRVHSFLAVSEAIARLTLAMKDHQRDVHNGFEVQFGLDIVIEGVPE